MAGLVVQPADTLRCLLACDRPPHLGSIVALMALVLAPIAVALYRWTFLDSQSIGVARVGGSLAAAVILSFPLCCAFLWLYGIRFRTRQLVALLVYGSAPPLLLILFYYAMNMVLLGRLTVVTFLITGNRDAHDWLILYLPVVVLAGHFLMIVVLFEGIKALGSVKGGAAAVITACSLLGFVVAFVLSLRMCAWLAPEWRDPSSRLLYSLVDITPLLASLRQ